MNYKEQTLENAQVKRHLCDLGLLSGGFLMQIAKSEIPACLAVLKFDETTTRQNDVDFNLIGVSTLDGKFLMGFAFFNNKKKTMNEDAFKGLLQQI